MSLSGTHSFFLPLDTSSTLDFHLAFAFDGAALSSFLTLFSMASSWSPFSSTRSRAT